MMGEPDLTFSDDGVFVTFYAETEAGRVAWNAMAGQMGGVARIMSHHFASVKAQLESAGYSLSEAAPVDQSIDDILQGLALLMTIPAIWKGLEIACALAGGAA